MAQVLEELELAHEHPQARPVRHVGQALDRHLLACHPVALCVAESVILLTVRPFVLVHVLLELFLICIYYVCVVHENVFAFPIVVALMSEQVAVAEAVAVAAE